jgi:hypothetical protein
MSVLAIGTTPLRTNQRKQEKGHAKEESRRVPTKVLQNFKRSTILNSSSSKPSQLCKRLRRSSLKRK